jgi:hypothetical protein
MISAAFSHDCEKQCHDKPASARQASGRGFERLQRADR